MSTGLNKEERRRDSEEKKRAQASKYKGILESDENNPCLKEHLLSTKCMSDNNYNESMCRIYFENYKACKSFWWNIQMDRRRSNITPELPPQNERVKIKDDYMKKMQQL